MKKKFAIPTLNGSLTQHFGHCERFAIVETENNTITNEDFLAPPAHVPGSFPGFLAALGVDVIIAGGMGPKAQDLFAQNNIEVCLGIEDERPRHLVEQYLNNSLVSGPNKCDDHGGGC